MPGLPLSETGSEGNTESISVKVPTRLDYRGIVSALCFKC